MKVLLVEPYYERKYPPLGLMKISTWHKKRGDDVMFVRGNATIGVEYDPDMIYVTSLFTWDLPVVVQAIRSFKHSFPNAIMRVGGVAASAIPDYIKDETGVQAHIGVLPEVDYCVPDYSLFPKLEESMLFTTRGCPHKCQYCIVKTIEPDYYELKGWEQSIDQLKPRIVVLDNNLLKASKEHIKKVIDTLANTGKQFDINSGFDVFLFNKEFAETIASTKIHPIRFAFDKMSQEKPLLNAVKACVDAGINPDKIRVYVLYNFKDTIDEAIYRAEKVIELKCKPFVMRYKPLDWMKKDDYVSEHWTQKDLHDFTQYFNMPVVWSQMSYKEFKEEGKNFSRIRNEKKKQNKYKLECQ